MGAFGVVEGDISADLTPGFRNVFISLQIDLLIFDGAPEPLDEDIVTPGTLSICYRQVIDGDLLPFGPSLILRVCWFGFHIPGFGFLQARRVWSPHIAQAHGALQSVSCCQAKSVA